MWMGVVAITHGSGCGMGGNGEELARPRRTLRGHAHHPDVHRRARDRTGREVDQIAPPGDTLAAPEPGMSAALTIQDEGGTRATIARGRERPQGMLARANPARRRPVPWRHRVVGLQCGGSDGRSVVSAAPALGAAVPCPSRRPFRPCCAPSRS
ncbi:MAG TPA: UxaA family hydrolase [Variovorax sp.]|nr:UxaA family hydrolase [Variovorax sp.]